MEDGVFGSSCLTSLESGVAVLLIGVCADFGVEVAVGLADLMGVFTVFSLLSVVPVGFFLVLVLLDGVALVLDGVALVLDGVAMVLEGVECVVFFTGVVSVFTFGLLVA